MGSTRQHVEEGFRGGEEGAPHTEPSVYIGGAPKGIETGVA